MMAEMYLTSQIYRSALRRERLFRDRTNPLEILDDHELFARYRFPRHKLLEIIDLCKDELTRPTNRNHALPVHSQVLCALRFYAKGTFQMDSGDLENISQPAVSRAIASVSKILCDHLNQFIKFPSDVNSFNIIKQNLYLKAKMPNVIGLVDGTLIFIKGPPGDIEPLYTQRKGGHAINVQVVCDHEMRIINIVAKWPGSTHDTFIWKNCSLRDNFMESPPNGWLLGDSGYIIEPWLMIPFVPSTNEAEENYNKSHKKTRRIIENCIGLWKSVFRCIDKSGGELQYSPEKVCKIIVATAILHNIRRELRLPQDENYVQVEEQEEIHPNLEPENILQRRGIEIRNRLVNEYFQQ